ncbi:MAG: SufS family cysteine desulfurase [Colwellia sp.]
MNHFDPQKFRQKFPLIVNNSALQYFDNAATTQKPQSVIDCYDHYYCQLNANVHRASHQLSAKATLAFEQARKRVQSFINAFDEKEIIWTKGTTESINLVAQSLGRNILQSGDEILLSQSEHHANIVPWQMLAQSTGAIIKVLPLTAQGLVDINALENIITRKTKIVCCAHISNVLGRINPLKKIITKAKAVGAITLIDGAQAVAHLPVDVQMLDCDFYVFSAHKMYGPTGVGVLYGKKALLQAMPPYQGGGEMIKTVSFSQETTYNDLPFKFEAGTPNIAGVIAFAETINFLNQYNSAELIQYERKLTHYFYQALNKLPDVVFIVEGIPDIPVLTFTLKNHHNHDIASALDSYGIALRSGHHCAMPLMEYLKIKGCLRVSLSAYNSIEEIDSFIASLKKVLTVDANFIKPAEKTNYLTDDISARFLPLKSWDSRHREIMLLGKELQRLDQKYRNEHSLIRGCESLAWLIVEKTQQGVFYFQADSDAKIIRGLLVIALAAFNGKTAEQIKSFAINDYFSSLGLIQHLSPSRGNGLFAIVEKIRLLVD